MSIKGIKPGQVIPFPNKPVEKKTEKSVEAIEKEKKTLVDNSALDFENLMEKELPLLGHKM